jgi:hypothetical protein
MPALAKTEDDVFRLRAGAVECDDVGVRIAGIELLDYAERGTRNASRKRCELPRLEQVEARLSRACGRQIIASSKLAGLRVVVDALNSGEFARAQIATLLLKLPDPPIRGAAADSEDLLSKRLHECGWLLKDFDPDKHPRAEVPPNPGWFAPRDDDDADSKKPPGVDVASNETGGTRSDADGGVDVAQLGVEPSFLSQDQSPEAVRERIAEIAQSLVDDQRWVTDGSYGLYPRGSNKCFLFVASVLAQAGADPGTPNFHNLTFRPPFAGQWADPTFNIPGWTVLGPDEAWAPGDVVAQQIGYGNASGHVMIIGDGNTFVGTGSHGNGPEGTIEQIPWQSSLTDNANVWKGPLVYRRWMGQ